MFEEPIARWKPSLYAAPCWALVGGFAARVLGDALQQHSQGPACLLLFAEIALLAVMARICWRMQRGSLYPDRRVGRMLSWVGAGYLAIALAMAALGHAAAAGFVLMTSLYHRRA